MTKVKLKDEFAHLEKVSFSTYSIIDKPSVILFQMRN